MENFKTGFQRQWLMFAILSLSAVRLSCGPGAPHEETTQETTQEAPVDLRQRLVSDLIPGVVLKDQFDITWQTHRLRGDIIRGYNVYVSREAGLSALPADSPRLNEALYNASTYPGDTDGDIRTETIRIEGVETGTRYFVHVRTAFPDGDLGPPSGELGVLPRPRGRLTLCPRFIGGDEGYSFMGDHPVPGDSEDNDLYIFATKSEVFLASPSRIDRSLRRTLFVDLGPSKSLDDHPRLNSKLDGEEEISVQLGRSVALIMGENRIAKLRPVKIDRVDDTVLVEFEYLYQPIAGDSSF